MSESSSREAAEKLIAALEALLGDAEPKEPELSNPTNRAEAQAFMKQLGEGVEDVSVGDQAADVVILVTALVHSGKLIKIPTEHAMIFLEITAMIGAMASMNNELYDHAVWQDSNAAKQDKRIEALEAMLRVTNKEG